MNSFPSLPDLEKRSMELERRLREKENEAHGLVAECLSGHEELMAAESAV